jgi:hypothetical protein
MTFAGGFLSVIILAALWSASLRYLGWGKPAPKHVEDDDPFLYVFEFVCAPLLAALVLIGDGSYRFDYGKWPS